jgi:hypothetical protein
VENAPDSENHVFRKASADWNLRNLWKNVSLPTNVTLTHEQQILPGSNLFTSSPWSYSLAFKACCSLPPPFEKVMEGQYHTGTMPITLVGVGGRAGRSLAKSLRLS